MVVTRSPSGVLVSIPTPFVDEPESAHEGEYPKTKQYASQVSILVVQAFAEYMNSKWCPSRSNARMTCAAKSAR